MYDDVLLPTAGRSPEPAFEHAVELARQFDATLHVLSVLDEAETGNSADGAGPGTDADDRARSERREGRQSVLRSLASEANDAGVATVTALREGVPHEGLLAYVREAGIDLVVMATHGRAGVDRLLLGSVTERVVRASPVPVVTVRMDAGDAVVTAENAEGRATAALAEEGPRECDRRRRPLSDERDVGRADADRRRRLQRPRRADGRRRADREAGLSGERQTRRGTAGSVGAGRRAQIDSTRATRPIRSARQRPLAIG